jgi:hypothetical protein
VREVRPHRLVHHAVEEDRALVREVGQPARSRLLAELRARGFALRREQRVDRLDETALPVGRDEAFQPDVSLFVQPARVGGGITPVIG